jgi:hypothetical protein
MKGRFGIAFGVLLAAALVACGSQFQKVTVHRTGGIAGLDEIYSVRQDGIGRIEKVREAVTRTVKLDKDKLQRIAAIAGRVPVTAQAPEFKSERGADFFNYELTLERDKGEPVIYHWDDGVHPADAAQESTLAALRDLSRAVIDEVKKAAER